MFLVLEPRMDQAKSWQNQADQAKLWPWNCQKIPDFAWNSSGVDVLSRPYCAIPREHLTAIPPYCALWGFWCLNMANWVRYPLPLFWAFPLWRACEVEVQYPPPPQRGISAILVRYPYENKANGCDTPPLCDTISKGYCAIWGGYLALCMGMLMLLERAWYCMMPRSPRTKRHVGAPQRETFSETRFPLWGHYVTMTHSVSRTSFQCTNSFPKVS